MMNTKEAKDFLVQQVAEQAALERVPLSTLEKRMLYFTESDPASCKNPLQLNDEFEAQYDTPEYERKIAQLLSHAYKRIKADDAQKAAIWNSAIRLLSDGDHYLLVMARGNTAPELKRPRSGVGDQDAKSDSGRNVVRCGSAAIAVFALIAALINRKLPDWVLPTLGMLLLLLCLLTMFFLAQQGYRAIRRKLGRRSKTPA